MALSALCSLVSCCVRQHAPAPAETRQTDAGIEKFQAYTQRYPATAHLTQNHATGHVGEFFFTHWKDGGAASLTLDKEGRFSVSWEGGGYNYVGGPGWHYGDQNRVIGYRFDQDSGANFIALYGWGYDKTMPASDPAHLVEYYILQRWSDAYNPSPERHLRNHLCQ